MNIEDRMALIDRHGLRVDCARMFDALGPNTGVRVLASAGDGRPPRPPRPPLSKYTPEQRDGATAEARRLLAGGVRHGRQRLVVAQVAGRFGVKAGTLQCWLRGPRRR